MKRLFLAILLCWLIVPLNTFAAASPLVISEFMASNSRTLADEDGEFSDWVELHNTGPSAVNLDGWFLTDDPAALTKWRLPATNLNARSYMVVFASNKDRRIPGMPLHTNFKLSSNGEYLALVQPDGVTIASDYAPAFPPQAADVSFGLDTGLRIATVLGSNATGRLLVPADDSLATNWVARAYNDENWLTAISGVGYSAGALATLGVPGLTSNLVGYWKFDETNGFTAADSSGRANSGALVNFPTDNSQWLAGRNDGALRFRGSPANDFVRVANYPKATNGLTVAAWVWADGRPTWASIAKNWGAALAGQFHFGLRDTGGDLDIFITTSSGQFNVREGSPIPTGQWHHVAFIADGATLRLFRNGALVASAPAPGNLIAPPIAALGIGVKLNDAGTAADMGAPGYWQGKIDDLALWNRALGTNEIAILSASGAGYGGFINTDLRNLMRGSNATCYLRFPFVVDNPDGLTRWRLEMRYDDGFVAWLNGEEVVRRNAPDELAWNSSALIDRANADAMVFEEFNLSFFEDIIVPGTNVLAIQGLNVNKDDADFLIHPVIAAASLTNTTNALVYFTTPTPGAENLVGVTVLGPIIKELVHAPKVPLDTDDLLVTARVAPAFAAVTNVMLRYRIMFSNEVGLQMFDDGAHNDGAAGDGTYGAVIPASASIPGQMVRYYVTAADALGRTNREPVFPGDPDGAPQYFGTVVQNPAVISALPILQWFAQDTVNARTRTGTRCAVSFNGEFYDNVFVRERGGFTSIGSQKFDFNRGYRFALSNNLTRVDEINLNNNTSWDPSYLRPTLGFKAYRDAGVPACIAFPILLRLNNTPDRVANYIEQVDEGFLQRNRLDPEGALYKLVQAAGSQPGFSDAFDGVEKKTRLFEDRSDMQALVSGLNLPTLAQRAAYLFDNFNIPNLVSYFGTRPIVQDQDSVRKNHYLYRDTRGTGEWRIFPWDKDLTFGVLLGPGVYDTHPLLGTPQYPLQNAQWSRLHETVLNHPVLKEMVLRRMRVLDDQMLQPPDTPVADAHFESFIDNIFPTVFPHVGTGASNAIYGAGGLKSYFPTRRRDLYVLHSATNLTNAIRAGIPSFAQPLNAVISIGEVESNPPSGNQAEEYIQLTNTSPFAVDISRWKLEGAVQFTFTAGAVLAASNVMYVSPDVVAFRARASGPRGGQSLFVQGNYQGQLSARGETLRLLDTFGRTVHSLAYPGNPSAAQKYLRITELMYHPSSLVGNTNGPEEFEFIELKNISTNVTVSLAGVRFVNGVEFNFTGSAVTGLAPGATVVIVKNLAAFTARYGSGFNIAGQYTRSLENRGERIQLVDARGEEILDFSYDNNWYPITDGFGFSLVVVNENAEPDAWDSKTNWRASGQLGGSPAGSDPLPAAIAPIRVNEVLSRTDAGPNDAIELYNPTARTVDSGGWWLSDDFNTPKKFRLPNGTMISAGGFVVFTEADFNPGGNGFALSSDGDEIWLFSADTIGNLTGYVNGHAFGAAEDGVTFGRYVTSVGEEHFVAQAGPSLGMGNLGPKAGPVAINEIMYHPPDLADGSDDSLDEFIELLNVATNAVPLFDPANAANPWKVTGGVDFTFPTNVTLGLGGFLLLVNFDPATNAAALAAFRTRYGVAANVQMFGPYGGKLDNAGESIELKKPTTPLAGNVPYVLVDSVHYRDAAPWPPGADGFGLSLQRRNASLYGDDPANWIATLPTAAAPTAGVAPPPVITAQPQSQTLVAFQNVMFSVSASGIAPLSYQWRFNGALLTGATNSILELANVQPGQAGNYDVLVFNSAGSVVSSNVTLALLYPASILQQPQSVATRPGSNITFSVAAYSPSPLHYQWQKDGVNIFGATNTALVLPNVQFTDGAVYTVTTTDDVGPVTSAPATLTILIDPTIVQPPVSQTVVSGGSFTLSVSVTNTATLPIGCLLRRNNVTLLNTLTRFNERTGFFTITGTNAGPPWNNYAIIVTNLAKPGGNLSASASITYLTDSDGDGIPDLWEATYGFGTNNMADGALDADGDGMSNWQEYIAGTDPTNRLSYLKIDSITAGASVTLSFGAVSNKTYIVQYSDALNPGPWSKLADVAARATNRTEVILDPRYWTNRFYRLATPRQP